MQVSRVRVLGMPAEFWLRLQMAVDLYDAAHAPDAKDIDNLPRLVRVS